MRALILRSGGGKSRTDFLGGIGRLAAFWGKTGVRATTLRHDGAAMPYRSLSPRHRCPCQWQPKYTFGELEANPKGAVQLARNESPQKTNNIVMSPAEIRSIRQVEVTSAGFNSPCRLCARRPIAQARPQGGNQVPRLIGFVAPIALEPFLDGGSGARVDRLSRHDPIGTPDIAVLPGSNLPRVWRHAE